MCIRDSSCSIRHDGDDKIHPGDEQVHSEKQAADNAQSVLVRSNVTWGVLMIEHNAVAAEQEAKSSKNDADFTGNNSAILAFVFCEKKHR